MSPHWSTLTTTSTGSLGHEGPGIASALLAAL
jgi:hypothetical protein